MTALRSRLVTPRAVLTTWLVVVWTALWQDASPAVVVVGLGVASLLVRAFPPRSPSSPAVVRVVPAVRFAAYFAWKMLEATVIVAWEVATPRNRIVEGVVAVPLRGVSPTVTALVANSISLTPGTLTLEVHYAVHYPAHYAAHYAPTVLYVHVLHLHDLDRVRSEIQHLEDLAIAAFSGSPTGETRTR